MKRRWKLGIALAAVGLAGFLVWAFRYEPNPGVAIRFLGYETNALPFRVSDISARFCLTNGSQRVIYCRTMRGIPSCGVETETSEGWFHESGAYPDGSPIGGTISLPPGQETCFSLYVLSLNRPFRVTVPFSTNKLSEVFWFSRKVTPKPAISPILTRIKNRVSSWFRSGQEQTSVSITIQDR